VTTLPAEPGAEQNIFLTACVTRDGSAWGGTDGSGVFRWRDGTLMRYGAGQGLTNLQVAVLFEDRHTNLWAGTWGGLFRFNPEIEAERSGGATSASASISGLTGGKFEPVPGPPALRGIVLALMEDRQGYLWAGTDGGLVRMHDGDARVFGERDGLTSLFIRAIEEDRDGQIWVAVGGTGLFRLAGKRFEHYATGQWPGERMIRALHADARGALWIATEGAGLVRLKDGRFTQYTAEDGLPNERLQAVSEDDAGNLWFGSDNGIFGCPRQTLEQYEHGRSPRLSCWLLSRADGLANKVCTGAGQPTAARAPDGRLWFPNGNALATFNPAHVMRKVEVLTPAIEEAFTDGVRQTPNPDGGLRVMSGVRRLELWFTSPNTTSPERLRFRIWMKGLEANWVDMGDTRFMSYSHLPPGQYEFRVAASGNEGDWIEAARALKIEVVPRFYERRSLQIAGGLALLAAVAGTVWRIERSRSRRRLERIELQRAMDQERQRIACDIHDDLGSGLTEIIMLSDRLRANLSNTAAAEKQIENISSRIR